MLAADPVVSVGAHRALVVAAGSVAALLVLIIVVKVQPLVALLLISGLTAWALGVSVDDLMNTLLVGLGRNLAEVGLLIGLGAMFGRMLEVSGGAAVVASALIRRFGQRNAPFLLGMAGLVFAFPVSFSAGLMIFLPVVLAVARRLGGSVLRYGLPVAGAFAAMAVYLPPHPGPVAAAGLLHADIGLLVLLGLAVAVPAWLIAGFGLWQGDRVDLPVPEVSMESGRRSGRHQLPVPRRAPSVFTVISMLLLPLVLILLNTGVGMLGGMGLVEVESRPVRFAVLLGESPIALLISVLVASVVLGAARGMRASEIEQHLTDCLGPVAAVIMVTAAGGMFGAVLEAGGVGRALAGPVQGWGVPLILVAFVLAAVMRLAQGSAVVALTTAAALVAPAVSAAEGLSPTDVCFVVIAAGAGAMILPHVNDSGFWLVGTLFGMDVPTTLRTWTVLESLIGVVGLVLAWGFSLVL